MKKPVAQAFQPAPGIAEGGCPTYRQELFGTVKEVPAVWVEDTVPGAPTASQNSLDNFQNANQA
jgi:hypothetical protein